MATQSSGHGTQGLIGGAQVNKSVNQHTNRTATAFIRLSGNNHGQTVLPTPLDRFLGDGRLDVVAGGTAGPVKKLE
jgi:hypothetical protein